MKIEFVYTTGIKIIYDLPEVLETQEAYQLEEEAIRDDIEFLGPDKMEHSLLDLKKLQEDESNYYTQAIGALRITFFNHNPSIMLIDTIVNELHKVQGLDDRLRLKDINLISGDSNDL